MTLGYPRSDWYWDCKVKGQGQRANKCIFTLFFAAQEKTNDPNVFRFGTGNDPEIS